MSNTTFEIDEIKKLAHEIAQRENNGDEAELFRTLSAHFTVDPEGVYAYAQANETAEQKLFNGLMRLALEQIRDVTERRPQTLECDVWRFQNKKEKWVAFVGLLDGRPYEIFTGLQERRRGHRVTQKRQCRLDCQKLQRRRQPTLRFSFENRRGYKTTVEGLSGRFNKEYWNYAKLISGVLRYRMPVDNVIRLIESLQLENDTINTWKAGVVRALKNMLPPALTPTTAPLPPSDSLFMTFEPLEIALRNLHFYAHHGVLPQEREVGAHFTLNLWLTVEEAEAAINEDRLRRHH